MSWQIYILLSVLLASISVLLQRVMLVDDSSQPKAYSVFFQLLTGIIVGIFGFLTTKSFSLRGVGQVIPNLLIMLILYGFGNVFIFKALKSLEASKFTIIFSSRALFTILASTLLLRESILPKQFVGVLLIFLGVVIVNAKSFKDIGLSKAAGWGLIAAIAFGLQTVNDRFLLRSLDLYPYLSMALFLPGVFIALINPQIIKKMKIFLNKKVLSRISILSLVYSLSAIAFFTALKMAPTASQVASINLTSVILTVLLGIIFLKERKNLIQKILGVLASFVGLLLVS